MAKREEEYAVSGYFRKDGRWIRATTRPFRPRRRPRQPELKVAAKKARVVPKPVKPVKAPKVIGEITADVAEFTPVETPIEQPVVQPVEQPETKPEVAAVQADAADVVSLGLRTLLAWLVAGGAYQVLLSVLWPMYGAGAFLRALVPLAVEMILGHAFSTAKTVAARGCISAGITLCIAAELCASSVAPQIAARQRVEAIQDEPAFVCAPYVQPPGYAGPKKTHALLEVYEAGCKRQAAAAAERKAERLASAKETTGQEAWLPTLLAILGAIGSACALPMLERFIRACGKRS